jgi:multimeric flavodoxin WrbA/putative sterol carrier protein
MKILLLRANPRKDGVSQKLIDLFVKGASETGEVTDIDLTSKNIKPCIGCYHCWTTTPGICVQLDDMKDLLESFLSCDIVVLASPLYAFAVSSYCKIFQERTMPLLAPGIIQDLNKLERNNLRFPQRMPKKLAAIIVGGLKSPAHTDGVVTSLKSFADGFGIEFAGALIRTESYIIQFTDTKPKTIKNMENAFYQAGQTLATEGVIPEILQQKAALQLAPDITYFQRYSNIYWDYAIQVSGRGGDSDEARVLTNRDITLLMHEVARSIDPVATKGIKAVFQFEFTDVQKVFTIEVDRGISSIKEQGVKNPNLVIRCTSLIWVSIILRELDPIKPLTAGEIVLVGDKSLFRKLHRYFPPPNT